MRFYIKDSCLVIIHMYKLLNWYIMHFLFLLLLQEDEESILQGEKEAEKMIVEAYAALLLAFLSMER